MKNNLLLCCFLFAFISTLSASRIRTKDTSVNLHLKDGSRLKGEKIAETKDSLYIENRFLGELAIPKKIIRYASDNYNNGKMLAIIPFLNEEKNEAFASKPVYKFSAARVFDERFSTSLDIGFMYQKFTHPTEKFLTSTTGADSLNDVYAGEYKYKANFIMPAIALRFSPLPLAFQKQLTTQYNLYPYLGISAGYNFGFVSYKLKESTNDDVLSSTNFEDKTHLYFGMNYQAILGISVKVSTRTSFVFETVYEWTQFKQRLTDKEKNTSMEQDNFILQGAKFLLGVRFGLF
jgi:hypothetical protein